MPPKLNPDSVLLAVPIERAMQRILIADDQPHVAEALRLVLKNDGFLTELADSPAQILAAARERPFDLVLLDLNYARDTTSGQEGLELLAELRALDAALPVVVMTAWGSIELAVEAMRQGARDFIQKPWENTVLLGKVRKQIALGDSLRRMQGLKKQRERELAEAQQIQNRLLPTQVPQISGCRIAAASRVASDLGGDYFDVMKFSDTRAAVAIADVVGKGLPAALLMSNLQAAVRAYATPETSPFDLCERVNRILNANCEVGKYVTFYYLLLDSERGTADYITAGHHAAVLVRADGTAERLAVGGPVLGSFQEWKGESGRTGLSSGDRIVLFTDGVTEAAGEDAEEFGEERLVQLLSECRGLEPDALLRRVLETVENFGAGALLDDATLLVVAVD